MAVFALLAWLIVRGFLRSDYSWHWGRLVRYFVMQRGGEWSAGPLLDGLLVTLELSFIAGVAAVGLGLLLAAARQAARPSVRLLASGYVQFMRCTPLLVQVYLSYFMFSNVLGVERFAAGAISLALFEAAFAAEIIRAGYTAVPQEQADAARAMGLARGLRLRFIIMPQALPLILPPLANLFVSLIKHSSIVTIIAIADLTDVARNIISDTFLVFEVWLAVGAMYIAICFPLAWLVGKWEQRLRRRTAG